MGANSEPHESVSRLYCECAMVATDSRRPEAPDLLEVQRRVARVLFETFVGLVRQVLELLWHAVIARPEAGDAW